MFFDIFGLNKKETERHTDGSKTVTTYVQRKWPWQMKRPKKITRYNVAGEKHGEEETYTFDSEGGFTSIFCPYTNNVKDGIEKELKNGKLVRETPWRMGGKIGVEKTYYSDGSPQSIIGYSGSVVSDQVVHYYPNGKIQQEGWHKMNAYGTPVVVKCGEWKEYDEEGHLTSITTYHDNTELSCKEYHPGGQVVKTETIYHEDMLIIERNFRPNGSIEKEETFDRLDNHQGLYITFDQNRGIADFEYFVNDDHLPLGTIAEIVQIFGQNSDFNPLIARKKAQENKHDL